MTARLESALAMIESASERRVCFVGETIRDEYRFVESLGRPAKEPIPAVRALSTEAWDGGVKAAYRHAATFCRAEVVTSWVPVVKTRYVERDTSRKLFEVQELPEMGALEVDGIPECGIIAVCDFGHGMIGRDEAKKLAVRPEFLAIAVQTNAANAGFNLVTKYRLADYIVIDEPEARLAAADRDSPIEAVMRRLAEGRCDRLVVTHGRHGAYGLSDGKFHHQPALSDRVIDTMGAGDAFFAVTASMAPDGNMEDLLLVGCAAGALKCETLGHRQAVTKEALIGRLRR